MNEKTPEEEGEVQPETGKAAGSAPAGSGSSRKYRWSGTADPALTGDAASDPAAAGEPAHDRDHREPEDDEVPEAPKARSADRGSRWRIVVAAAVPVIMVAAFLVARSSREPKAPVGDDPLVRYCATVVERDSIQLPNPAQSGSEEVKKMVPVVAGRLVLLTEKMMEVAPDDAKAGLRRQEEAYRALVRTRDAAGFRSAELLASRNQVNQVDIKSCNLDQVEFAAAEFRYTGVPEKVGHGKASLQMVNEGKEAHEFVLYRRKPDFGGDFTRILRRDSQDEEAISVASGYAAPGARSNVVADLVGGDYVMVCLLRTGNEAHWQKGMITEFTVE